MDILDNIGNTPLYKINDKINDIYLKFEGEILLEVQKIGLQNMF